MGPGFSRGLFAKKNHAIIPRCGQRSGLVFEQNSATTPAQDTAHDTARDTAHDTAGLCLSVRSVFDNQNCVFLGRPCQFWESKRPGCLEMNH